MKMQIKWLLAMVPIIGTLVFIAIFASSTITQLSSHSQIILKDNFQSVLSVQGMMEAVERIDSGVLFRLTGRTTESEALVKTFQPLFSGHLQAAENNITEPGEREILQQLQEEWRLYQEKLAAFFSLSPQDGAGFYSQELYPLFLVMKESTQRLLRLNQDAMVRKSAEVQASGTRIHHLTLLVVLVTSGLGILLSIFLARQILQPLSILAQTVRQLATGNLEARAPITGNDEIAELAREFNLMAEQLLLIQRSSLGELLRAQQTTQAAIDSLPDPVIILDSAGTILSVNRAGEEELKIGVRPSDLRREIEMAAELKETLDRVGKHILSGQGTYLPRNFDEAVRIVTGEGEKFFLPRGNPLLDDRRIIGATIIMQDITRLRRFDRLKSDLVATVAHEFRTPLTSLRMAIHLLLEHAAGALSAKQEDLLFSSREDCERLQLMVDELLDLSRLQDGKIRMILMPCPAQTLIETALASQRLLAEERGCELMAVLPPETLSVRVDADRIQIVLKNLLVNAIRHSPPQGKIRISLAKGDNSIRIGITDSGPGIPPEHQARLFERFFRVPGTVGPGTGLGLSICREIIEKHGGEIGVESVYGTGCTFWFTLPSE